MAANGYVGYTTLPTELNAQSRGSVAQWVVLYEPTKQHVFEFVDSNLADFEKGVSGVLPSPGTAEVVVFRNTLP